MRIAWSNIVLRICLIFILFESTVCAQEIPVVKDSSAATIRYGSKGFEFRTIDNKFLLQIQSRLQFRFSTPQDQDPLTYDDFGDGKHRHPAD